MARQVNQATLDLIASQEGDLLFAYDDAVSPPRPAKPGEKIRGTLTAGRGHTGPDVTIGMTVTRELDDKWFAADIGHAAATVERLVTVPLNDNEFGALVSFTENCGAAAFEGSTLLKLVNAGRLDRVPAELEKWDHTHMDGKLIESDGLKKRRKLEGVLWSSTAASIPPSPLPTNGNGTTPAATHVGAKPTANPANAATAGLGGIAFVTILQRFVAGDASPLDYVLAFVALGVFFVFLVLFLRKGK